MSNIQKSLKDFFAQDGVKKKFVELLGEKKAPGFITGVMQVTTGNSYLSQADPVSVYNAAAMAAILDLPINNNLGFAYIVPYNESFKDATGNWQKRQLAQFQIAYKGFIQLAQRSGLYDRLNVIAVYENQFKSFNYLTEELNGDFTAQPMGEVVGYASYFRLLNGFEKLVFWTKAQVEAHGERFSKSFKSGPWKTDFDAMAKKTLIKSMLTKWGPMSLEMQQAVQADQAVVKDFETAEFEYVDNPDESVDTESEPTKESVTDHHLRSAVEEGHTKEEIESHFNLTNGQKLMLEEMFKK